MNWFNDIDETLTGDDWDEQNELNVRRAMDEDCLSDFLAYMRDVEVRNQSLWKDDDGNPYFDEDF